MKGIYRFSWDVPRGGEICGIFTAESSDIEGIIDKEIYLGEVLGKHSDVSGVVEKDEIELITEDPFLVSEFDRLGMETGYNPLDYYES